jgi:hypothetical protein
VVTYIVAARKNGSFRRKDIYCPLGGLRCAYTGAVTM